MRETKKKKLIHTVSAPKLWLSSWLEWFLCSGAQMKKVDLCQERETFCLIESPAEEQYKSARKIFFIRKDVILQREPYFSPRLIWKYSLVWKLSESMSQNGFSESCFSNITWQSMVRKEYGIRTISLWPIFQRLWDNYCSFRTTLQRYP